MRSGKCLSQCFKLSFLFKISVVTIMYFIFAFNSDCGRNVYYKLDNIKDEMLREPDVVKTWNLIAEGSMSTKREEEDEEVYLLPNKIHFIHFELKLPDHYIRNIKSYLHHNPQYETFLWVRSRNLEILQDRLDKENVKRITVRCIYDLPLINKELILSRVNSALRADMLKYEILYHEGGIYTDIDSIALRPYDERLSKSFIIYDGRSKVIENGCFGFHQGSKFLLNLIRILRDNYEINEAIDAGNDKYVLTSCFLKYNDDNVNIVDSTHLINPSITQTTIPCLGPVYAYHF